MPVSPLKTKAAFFDDLLLSLRNYYLGPCRPVAAFINLTERCNLKCSFCELGGRGSGCFNKKELSFEEIVRIAEQLAGWGVKRVQLGGGEPAMRQDIWDILEAFSSRGLRGMELLTNGTLFGRISGREKDILKKSVGTLSVSLDSADPEIHDSIRGAPGAFVRTVSFLEKASRDYPASRINCVITRDTFRGIPALVRFLKRLRIRRIGFQPVNFYSNYPHYKAIEDKDRFLLRDEGELEELMSVLREGIRLSRALRVKTNLRFLELFIKEYFLYAKTDVFFFDRLARNFICSNVFNHIYIDAAGAMMRCFLVSAEGTTAGEDLKDNWRRHAFFAKSWSMRREFYPVCRSCHCGFASNFRRCLVYRGVSNFNAIMRILARYFMRPAGL